MRRRAAAAVRQDNLVQELGQRVIEAFDLEPGQLLDSRNQLGNVVTARHLLFYLLHLRWSRSYPEIQRGTGFDDSTVRQGVLSIAERLKRDRALQQIARAFDV